MGAKKSNSFVGTPDYLAPEIVVGESYTILVDYWAFGCLLYEMTLGFPPFSTIGSNQKVLFETIRRVAC